MRVVALTAIVALMIVSTAAADGVKVGVNIGVGGRRSHASGRINRFLRFL